MIKANFSIELKNKSGHFNLIFNESFKKGEVISLFGPSGSGKTTFLRVMAGLIAPDKGTITVNNQEWYNKEKKINLPPQKRNVGFLFQDYALFPNMTVEENLNFVFGGKETKSQKNQIIDDLLNLVKLYEYKKRKPQSLSGGQKQRLALIRALIRKPDILLLDEPFSALDPETRYKLQDDIISLQKSRNITTFLVTHSISEVYRMADHVILIENGRTIESGKTNNVLLKEKVSSNVKLVGEILNIEKRDVLYVITVLVGYNDIIKVTANEEERNTIRVGDNIIIYSNTFDPMFKKIG